MERRADTDVTPSSVKMPLPRRRSILRFQLQFLLFMLDMASLFSAVMLAGALWHGRVLGATDLAIVAAFTVCYFFVGANAGVFSSDILTQRRRSVFLGMRSVLIASVGVILAAFFLKAGAQISRVELVISGGLGSLLVGFARALFQSWTLHHYGARLHSEIVIVDDRTISTSPDVYVLDAAAFGLRCDLADPLMLDRIGRLVATVDRVIIVCSPERRRNWAMVMKGANVHAEILSPELTEIGPLGTGRFENSPTVVVAAGSLDLRQRFIKRCLDLSLAMIALILFAPLLLCVAVAVRFDSPGSIFFVQDRVGRGNRLFGIYKFRSMRADACDRSGNRSTSRDDDRITRVGRFIRATSLDEFPQLFNILKGEMSFVGPRPHALGSLAGDLLFWEVDERYWHRHVCKPGMTGLAQVRGYRGATHRESDLTDRLQADLEYVAGWTILRDISILFATLRVVVHRNAF